MLIGNKLLYNNKEKSCRVLNKSFMNPNSKINVAIFLAMISKQMAMAIMMTIVAAACFRELLRSFLLTKNIFQHLLCNCVTQNDSGVISSVFGCLYITRFKVLQIHFNSNGPYTLYMEMS